MTFIYCLRDPLSGEVRYVGISNDPKKRFARHLRDARIWREDNHKARWVRSLLLLGFLPTLEILDETTDAEGKSLECAYIQFFREQGARLTNGTDGGDGWTPGKKHRPETRQKISASNLGKTFSPETRAKMSAWQVGRTLTAEHRANLAAAGMGRRASPETRAKRSASLSGSRNPMFGKRHSPERRARISESGKQAWVVRKSLANSNPRGSLVTAE